MAVCSLEEAIRQYALAYQQLEEFQGPDKPLPVGDQKTGCIGEYYALRYLKKTFPSREIKLAPTSQKAWDISINYGNDQRILVQTKTVSEYSKSKRISPIHHGCDWLFFVYLNRSLYPVGFWIVDGCEFLVQNTILSGQSCPVPGTNRKGSGRIPFGENRIDKLLESLKD